MGRPHPHRYEPFTCTDVRLDVKAGNRGTNNNTVSLFCSKSDAGWYQFDIASNGLFEIFFVKPVGSVIEYILIADGGSGKITTDLAENEYGLYVRAAYWFLSSLKVVVLCR